MSAGEPNANQPPRLTARERVLLILTVASMWLVLLAMIGGGGWAGHALSGKFSGAVAGAGIGMVAAVVAVQRFVLCDNAIETGCIAIVIVVLAVAAYVAARDVDKKIEEGRSRNAVLTTAGH